MFHVKHMEMEGGGGHSEEGGSQVFVPLFHVKHEADSDGGADPVLSTSAIGTVLRRHGLWRQRRDKLA